MSKRVLCPRHEEKTPSCEVYVDGWYCFGCGAAGALSELGFERLLTREKKHVEDICRSIDYIRGLPLKPIRGLIFPADASGFYVLWPDGQYYKRRAFSDATGPKYRGPAGITKPLFQARVLKTKNAIVVEGELNALSMLPCVKCDVLSPGGASDFYSSRFEKDLLIYKNYDKILILVDADAPGVKAAIEFTSLIREHVGCVLSKSMKKDANEILIEYGYEGLEEELERMGLSAWVQNDRRQGVRSP